MILLLLLLLLLLLPLLFLLLLPLLLTTNHILATNKRPFSSFFTAVRLSVCLSVRWRHSCNSRSSIIGTGRIGWANRRAGADVPYVVNCRVYSESNIIWPYFYSSIRMQAVPYTNVYMSAWGTFSMNYKPGNKAIATIRMEDNNIFRVFFFPGLKCTACYVRTYVHGLNDGCMQQMHHTMPVWSYLIFWAVFGSFLP